MVSHTAHEKAPLLDRCVPTRHVTRQRDCVVRLGAHGERNDARCCSSSTTSGGPVESLAKCVHWRRHGPRVSAESKTTFLHNFATALLGQYVPCGYLACHRAVEQHLNRKFHHHRLRVLQECRSA